jgi:hypothetical protein
MTTHVLRPVPPLRAYALAAILSAIGAVLLVAGLMGNSIWVVALGALFMSCGLVLLGATLASVRRYRVSVDLDEHGYAIHGSVGDQSGSWDDVTRVTRSADGNQLTFHQGDERRTVLVGRGVTTIEGDVARYLDINRGYGSELS